MLFSFLCSHSLILSPRDNCFHLCNSFHTLHGPLVRYHFVFKYIFATCRIFKVSKWNFYYKSDKSARILLCDVNDNTGHHTKRSSVSFYKLYTYIKIWNWILEGHVYITKFGKTGPESYHNLTKINYFAAFHQNLVSLILLKELKAR